MLIDLAKNGYSVEEVDLKKKEHKHQKLKNLVPMAEQIVDVIFDRAEKYGRLIR